MVWGSLSKGGISSKPRRSVKPRIFQPRTAFIPIAADDVDASAVVIVEAAASRLRAAKEHLFPSIASLSEYNLYEPGHRALTCVERFPGGFQGVWRNVTGARLTAHVSVGNQAEISGIDLDNNASAQLGIALNMLMFEAQSKLRTVIATGKLADIHEPDGDVKIEPVDKIALKIGAVRKRVERKGAGEFAPETVFFLPAKTVEGDDCAAVFGPQLEELEQALHIRGVKLEIVFADSLMEAAALAGVRQFKAGMAEKLVGAGLAAALIGALAVFAVNSWANGPMAVSFAPIATAAGDRMTPLRAFCAGASCRFRDACPGQEFPIFRVNESVLIKVKASGGALSDWGGYQFAFIIVDSAPDAQIIVATEPMFEQGAGDAAFKAADYSDDEAAGRIGLTPPAGAMALFIAAQRLHAIDPVALKDSIRQIVRRQPQSERFNAVGGFLHNKFPGHQVFQFMATEDDEACPAIGGAR